MLLVNVAMATTRVIVLLTSAPFSLSSCGEIELHVGKAMGGQTVICIIPSRPIL